MSDAPETEQAPAPCLLCCIEQNETPTLEPPFGLVRSRAAGALLIVYDEGGAVPSWLDVPVCRECFARVLAAVRARNAYEAHRTGDL